MILFYLFIALFIGVNIRVNLILGLVESLIIISLAIIYLKSKKGLLVLFPLAIGIGLSFIRPSYNFNNDKIVVVNEVKDNYYLVSYLGEKLYVYEKEHNHEVGDILKINGYKSNLDFVTIESSFDFAKYLNNKGVYQRLYIEKKQIIFSNFIKIHACKKNFLSHFDLDTKVMVDSILFSGGGSEDTKELFSALHLNRLISASGIYLSIFDYIFVFLLSYLFKKEKYVKLGSIFLLIIYSVFTFPRFVVMKFVTIKIMRFINEYYLKKRFSYLSILSISGIFFLLINYHLGYQDGFFLSYFIPILILFINGSFKRLKNYQKRLLILPLVLLAFVPFYASYYHDLSIFSPILQILLTPLLVIYLLLSILSFFYIPLYSALNGYTQFFNILLKNISPIMLKIHVLEFDITGIFIYECLYILLLFFISIGNKDIYKFLFSISALPFLIVILPIKPLLISTVSFINVGQGDSCLIQKGNTTVLIDTGGNIYQDIAKEALIPYFKKNQIYDIDLLITTHNDFDHMGAANSLINNFNVKRYVTTYEDFPINIGNITLTNYNTYSKLWEEDNDASLVIGFKMANLDFLIMGDAPKKIEKAIIKEYPNLKCDILKVGHHGSKTSSDPTFISYLKPKEAIVSVGKNNSYGHPHQEVINILNKYHVKIRRTDLEGTIKYSFLLK